MPFVIKKDYNYFWPVKHSLPASGGKFETFTFDAQFKRLGDSRLKQLLRDENNNDQIFCREVLVGWKGVEDEQKAEIPFSESARDELLDQAGLAASIVTAYLESVAGQKVKN